MKEKQEIYDYRNQFAKEKYDRLNIQVPKGQKAIIEKHWRKQGYKSLNSYVNDLIKADMNKCSGGGQLESSQTTDWTDTENHATISLEVKEE